MNLNLLRSIMVAATCWLAVSAAASESKYIKAVTYFGAAWPINFWNSNLNRAAADFKEIKADGFNAVVLVVPWGEFQPGLDPVRFNDDAYRRLTTVCRTAQQHKLQVYLRVAYLWDMYPGRQMPNIERVNALVSNDTLMPAWQQYLKRIGNATEGCANGSFISWEDFWSVIHWAESVKTEQDGAALSRLVGFDAWARKHAERSFLEKHGAAEKRLGAYPIPIRKSSDFRVVFKWFDDQLTDRLMPALAKNLPNASIEARVDDDPIYDGDKLLGWYSHKQTYRVPSSPFVMTYWAPAMGAQNRGEIEPAKKVLDRFSYMQKKIADQTSNKIFIEQFLFKDNTPSMTMNATIAPAEVSTFIKTVAGPMVRQTSGYALWGARDYDASTVFNGYFSLGEMDWKFAAGAKVIKAGDTFLARLPKGATITQPISSDRDLYRGFAKSTTLRFRASGPGMIEASYAGATNRVKIGASSELVNLTFPVAVGSPQLSLTSVSGTVQLTDVTLFNFTQTADVRDSLGRPSRHLTDIRALNKLIDAGGDLPSRLAAADNTLGGVAGVSSREQDGSRWYAWAGPEVQARILARVAAIKVQGYIKPSMFKRPGGCTLDAYVDGAKAASQVYAADGPIELSVPIASAQVGAPVDLRLSSSCAINPKQQKQGNDDRNLSFVLTEISAQPK